MAKEATTLTTTLTAYEQAMLDETRAHNARMAEIAAQGIAAPTRPVEVVSASPNAQFEAATSARRGIDNPPLPVTTVEGCCSTTGSTFTAKIDHNGRVVDLLDYTWPDGVDVGADSGGLCPSGYTIGSKFHDHWKWTDFRQADINTFVGKPLPNHIRNAAVSRVAPAEAVK